MADVTLVNLVQDAVLWPFAGYDDLGQSLVGQPVDVKVRWDGPSKREIQERDRTEKTSSATVFVGREVALGSVLRKGTVALLPSPVTDLHDVINYQETPDIKGRYPSRVLQVQRRTVALPAIVVVPDPGESTDESTMIIHPFSWGDASQVVYTLPTGKRIVEIEVRISTAFNGTNPSIKLGYTGNLEAFLAASDTDVSRAGSYTVLGMSEPLNESKALILTITSGVGTSVGQGTLVLHVQT